MKRHVMPWLIGWLLMLPACAFAGPGGKIAKVVAETFWGKVVLVIVTIVFLPLIIYVIVKEHRAKKRVLRALAATSEVLPGFAWPTVRRRAKECFERVHSAWEKADVSEASRWMTDWYWQNQQLVYLDKWEREGLANVCRVYKVNHVKPILFSLQSDDGIPGQGSELAVLIEAKMTDYLERKSDGKVVEGSRKKKDVERVWSFIYDKGNWVVADIDEGDNSLEYIEMMAHLPDISESIDLLKSKITQSGGS